MAEGLKEKSISAFLWVVIDKFGGGLVNFLVTIVLARLLTPEDFGLVAMVLVVFSITNTFIDSGFSDALIRKEEVTEADKSTTFLFNLGMAVFLYGILFFTAPLIARFFEEAELAGLIRIMGLNLVIGSLSIIQRTMFTRSIDFKTLTRIRVFSVVLSGSLAITAAILGFGVWSLVIQLMAAAIIDAACLYYLSRWMPNLSFSLESFRYLFGFGSKLLLSSLIVQVFNNLQQLVIGKYFSAGMLGYYAQANNYKQLVINTFFMTIRKVTYPVLATIRFDLVRLKSGYRKIIKISSFALIPTLVLMAVLAEPMIVTLVGDKWLPAVPILQLLCLGGLTYHFSALNTNILLVLGHVGLGLRLEIIKKAFATLAIVVGLFFGFYGVIIGGVITAYFALFINVYYTRKFLDYGFAEQFGDISTTLFFSVLAGGVAVLLKSWLPAEPPVVFILVSLFSFGLYLVFHLLAKSNEIGMIQEIVVPRAMAFLKKPKSQNI